MYRLIKILLIVVSLVAAVLWFLLPSKDDPEAINNSAISFMFLIMWVCVIAAALLALFFGVTKMLTTPGGLKKALFSVVGLAVLLGVGYVMSNGDEANAVVETMKGRGIETSAGTVKNIGMLLNAFFGMTVIAVALMVVPGVKRIFGR